LDERSKDRGRDGEVVEEGKVGEGALESGDGVGDSVALVELNSAKRRVRQDGPGSDEIGSAIHRIRVTRAPWLSRTHLNIIDDGPGLDGSGRDGDGAVKSALVEGL
jgi:hypothetical protein